jgi:hypothetical protein
MVKQSLNGFLFQLNYKSIANDGERKTKFNIRTIWCHMI